MVKWILLACVVTIAVVSVISRRVEARRQDAIADAIRADPSTESFDESMVQDLPAVAKRYFGHAIRPGTPLARSVWLAQSASMRPSENGARLELRAEQWLTAGQGFLWAATTKIGPLPFTVVDHYAEREGAVQVRALGIVPIETATGYDVTRSSRHRLAAESVWLPASLLPRTGARWIETAPNAARVTIAVDEDVIELNLSVGDDGSLRSVSLERHGDVGVESWQSIPYGFDVEAEGTFGGFTIPTRVRGGWWYGTDRYDPDDAAVFVVSSADFR